LSIIPATYTPTKYHCPLCGAKGLLKRRERDLNITKCQHCDREMLIILDPMIQEEGTVDPTHYN